MQEHLLAMRERIKNGEILSREELKEAILLLREDRFNALSSSKKKTPTKKLSKPLDAEALSAIDDILS